MMVQIEYDTARGMLGQVQQIPCDAALQDHAAAVERKCDVLAAVLRSFPEKGSGRERIVRIERTDEVVLVAVLEGEGDLTYNIRLPKGVHARIPKEEVRQAQILNEKQLDDYYADKIDKLRKAGSHSATERVRLARTAYTYGLPRQVHEILDDAYALDQDLESLAIE